MQEGGCVVSLSGLKTRQSMNQFILIFKTEMDRLTSYCMIGSWRRLHVLSIVYSVADNGSARGVSPALDHGCVRVKRLGS